MCTTVGLAVMGEMMTAEMTAKVGGPKHAKLAQRQGNWHGSAPGSAVLGGRRVPVERPRGRTVIQGLPYSLCVNCAMATGSCWSNGRSARRRRWSKRCADDGAYRSFVAMAMRR